MSPDEIARRLKTSALLLAEGTPGVAAHDQAELALALSARVAELERALAPFVGFADVLNPGDNGHSSFGIYADADDDKSVYRDAEGAEKYPDDKVIIAAGAGWPRVPASYVTHLTMGDFRQAHAVSRTITPEDGDAG